MSDRQSLFRPTDRFESRHIGSGEEERRAMLRAIGVDSIEELMGRTLPASIRLRSELRIPGVASEGESEHEVLADLRRIASRNRVFRSYIGTGYSGTITPAVILRNILENPGWYTQYTPYQAEIAQGRLEALLNFQTMVMDLTGMEIANASLLDEGTAAAEAMAMALAVKGREKDGSPRALFISDRCHPQTIAVVQTRAKALDVPVVVAPLERFDAGSAWFGAIVQYPCTDGAVLDYAEFTKKVHSSDALLIAAADPLALALLKAPGEWGADIAVGSTQRFGVPMGFGGPHAAYLATKDEYKRQMPGRIVGLSKDVEGKPAIRLALQTREQHIRRDKATSNICTAQVLLAVMASMYAVYHGPQGLRAIARRIHGLTAALADGAQRLGYKLAMRGSSAFFDTITLELPAAGASADEIRRASESRGINLRWIDSRHVGISLDETVLESDLDELLAVLAGGKAADFRARDLEPAAAKVAGRFDAMSRQSAILTHPVFNTHHSESEMMRYLHRLQARDLSLVHSMIPLGSCTMKLNAAAEMLPITWPEFASLHPFVPAEQAAGYAELLSGLENQLSEVTGFAGISLQPNAGSQGEYAGLLVIKAYHQDRGEGHRDVCLIPLSAHGTNPATAVMAGFRVIGVRTDEQGNIDVADLRAKADAHAKNLGALMVTYPSTHGVFESSIREVCDIIHRHGGQVYMDGANMNAQVGLCRPADFGADVCHLNLHKTFCIPHGGGGPGMGPIGVQAHLKPFLPGHPVVKVGGEKAIGPISAAPYGSAAILPISYAYIRMMGAEGLRNATETAILGANYMAVRLDPHFPVLYKGENGFVAHECIIDLRSFKAAGIEVEDVAKRLMDYGYHAPTISWPVPGTMMIEPTESESKAELDRFCEAMIAIREEIAAVERGKIEAKNCPVKLAPHTAEQVTRTEWTRAYSREQAAFPLPWVKASKFWPAVARIDNVYGDRNLVCACGPVELG